MANDYLVSKWRTWFGFFDHNKDGKVCYADMETARGKFTNLHHLEGEKKKKSNDAFTKWWVEYVMWGSQEITVDQFIERQNAAFKADKEKFIERMHKCEEIICGFVDVAGDGYMSEQEILIILKAGGYGDEAKDKKFFQEFNPKGGKIPVKEMIELWTHYLTSEDSSIPDPCKKGFDDVGI
ncbi:sarcoplasmic calcium-binding protein-like [Mercenaria mercenaria]|uniref:sarcoplasmic calcium-binding protein-like n=1 Tax=Mercenaria mercenaria TaxID=6596 RepID=UPI00234F7BF1|nr:sarcoplasmic calcium-binding protein-like [Mercenaria mercenaria]